MREIDVPLPDGRTLHAYDVGPAGTPNTGEPPVPLLGDGVRWISHDRPGYGGSTPHPGRDVASVAADVAAVADALGVGRFVAAGHSGGGPHALACAALLPDRVAGVLCICGIAPRDADGLDWFAGMAAAGAAELRAADAGRDALAELLASAEFDPDQFTESDHAALAGPWS
jgi:pimeloyl-ACP methyl ester carboxylesterase